MITTVRARPWASRSSFELTRRILRRPRFIRNGRGDGVPHTFRMEQNASASRVQVHAHVEPEVRAELLAVARSNDRSLAAEVRRAIDAHLKQKETS